MRPAVSVVVPTLGGPPELPERLGALAQSPDVEIVLVHQGPPPAAATEAAADRCLVHPRPLGFAAAVNRGLEEARGELVLLLNDDAEVGPDAVGRLTEVLRANPAIAAVQPAILDGSGRIDSLGIGWNRWWQPIQRGRGCELGPRVEPAADVFGVHAAVGLFRREALDDVAVEGEILSETLHTYYEDVELAGRLRAAGWQAVVHPEVKARHSGGASAASLGRRRISLLYGNRLLVLARLLGPSLVPRLPRALTRDVLDAISRPSLTPGILRGWLRAARLGSAFAGRCPARLDPSVLHRYRDV